MSKAANPAHLGRALCAWRACGTSIARPPPSNPNRRKKPPVYVTRTGEKYNLIGCSSLRASSIPISLKDAEAKGYTACKLCHPSQ